MDIDIAKILGLAKGLISHRKITSLMKCSKTAVQQTLTTYLFEMFQGKNLRREYQWKTTEHEDWYIEHALKQNLFMPLKDITNILPVQISTATLWHQQLEAYLDSYIVAQKPRLCAENVVKRLELILKYKDWTVEDWKCII